jgi:multidrug efflux system membrane fusion protein
VRKTYITALIIIAACVVWLFSGIIGKPAPEIMPSLAETKAAAEGKSAVRTPAHVRARVIRATDQTEDVVVRATTASKRTVEVRSMVSGRVASPPVEVGTPVKAGQLLCQLDPADREAWVAEGEAAVTQARLEQEGNLKLQAQGYQSETQSMAAKAKLAGAVASLSQRRIELERTTIRAPFDGVVEVRQAELGAFLQPGAPCVTLIAPDPILVVGQVAEKDVSALHVGQNATARLIDGRDVTGTVSFVALAAQSETRTYRVEVLVPNPDHSIRSGITADLRIPRGSVKAHRISPALLALDDGGGVGVRIVDDAGIVHMLPVTVIKDDSLGVWVTGLPEAATVITVGQELVVAGDSVDITYEPEAEPTLPEMPQAADQTAPAGAVPGEALPAVETALVAPADTNPS